MVFLFFMIVGCSSEPIKVVKEYFQPPSGHTFNNESPIVSIINLDHVSEICFSNDGTQIDLEQEGCASILPQSKEIELIDCGFNIVNIAWNEGKNEDSANYQVLDESCEEDCQQVLPWSNDELVRAFAKWQDETRCLMNSCQDPQGPGSWSADCDQGDVDWEVELNGLRAVSEFSFNECAHTVEIEVHDYIQDPQGTDPFSKTTAQIELMVSGVLIQDTDFSGNGNESGLVQIEGDFTGTIESQVIIFDKKRGGGGFRASCTVDPFENEECAPSSALISYDFPDWTCRGNICPLAQPDSCEVIDEDEDGVLDESDNCPQTPNTDQQDIDEDGVGDACDDAPDFVLIQFKFGERCLTLANGNEVNSTSTCAPLDPRQQWEIFEDGGYYGFRNLSDYNCLSQSGILAGPWDVITEPCDGSDKQKWSLEEYDQGGFDQKWPLRLHNRAEDFCPYTDLTGYVYGTVWNCGLAGTENNRKVGLYWGGDFTSNPIQP